MDIGKDNYSLLIDKLDGFIRKYYANQIIRGAIWFGAVMLSLFLILNLLEYQFYFSSKTRTFLFYFFSVSLLGLLYFLILQYVLKYFSLGKTISHKKAATIIGQHFGEVKDKLYNILQLKEANHDFGSIELINASINQKIKELQPIPFVRAVDLSKNKKYLKYLLPPVMVILFLIIAAPNLLKESTKHYVQHDTHFERKAPFEFELKEESLQAIQFSDFMLNMHTSGNFQPRDMYINIAGFVYKMKNDSIGFSYEFKNVQKDIPFHFEANGFSSKTYELKVIPKPIIAGFDVSLNYPSYTEMKDESFKNNGDLSVPYGTKATWRYQTEFVDQLEVKMGGENLKVSRSGEHDFIFSHQLRSSCTYTIKVYNHKVQDFDSVQYTINVIPDIHPSIILTEFKDSTNTSLRYYSGDINDDYGLTKLTFNYRIDGKDSNGKNSVKAYTKPVSFKGNRTANFVHTISLKSMGLNPGDQLSYYFEVWDNDGVQGPKSSRSNIYQYKMPSVEQLEKQTDESNKELKKDLASSVKDAKKLQQEAKELRDKLLEKKNMEWNDKQQLEKLLQKEKQLETQIEQMKNEMKQNFEQQKEFKEQDQRILDKQKQLEELMNDILTPEMKDLYKQLEELMQKMDKEKMMDNLEKMDMKNEKLEKELDKMLELFKNLEYNQKMEETADKLEKLAREQEKLSEEIKNGITDELKKKQEELNKKMDDAKKDIDALNKMNQEKNKGKEEDFNDVKKETDEAEKNQEDAQEEMKNNNKEGASKKQKEAAKDMKEAAQKLKNKMRKQQKDQQEEDFEMLRRLLENLLYLSFEQEKLVGATQNTPINTPTYVKNTQTQYKLKDDFKLVEDTLYTLASRQAEVKKFVFDEVDKINERTKKALKFLVDRNIGPAIVEQQSVMMHYNNLTLMLSEVMMDMQEEEEQQEKKGGTPGEKKTIVQKEKIQEQLPEFGANAKAIEQTTQRFAR